MKASPAFQFYPADWLGSQRVTLLSLAEEGAYIRLLAYCWKHGGIPSNPKECAKLIGKGASTTLTTVVQRMFEPNPNNPSQLVHSRLEEEREKQAEWSRKSSEGGRKSAEARAGKKSNQRRTKRQPPLNGGSTTLDTVDGKCLEPNGNTSSTSSFSSSPSGVVDDKSSTSNTPEHPRRSTKSQAATPGEVEEFAITVGCLPGQGTSFFWKMEGNGWTNGGKPVKDWKAVIRHWHAEGYMPKPAEIQAVPVPPREFADVDAERMRAGFEAMQAEEDDRLNNNSEFDILVA